LRAVLRRSRSARLLLLPISGEGEVTEMDEDRLIAEVRQRLRRLNESAGALTQALGLPPEDKHEVLARMASGERSAPDAIAALQPESEDALKRRAYRIIEGFLSERWRDELPRFRAIWDRIASMPLAALSQPLRPEPAAGLGFADDEDELVAAISVIRWLVSTASETGDVQWLSREGIRREALKRGCSTAGSAALARYLMAHLPDLS
jgi:hypothetical protein